MQFLFSRQFLHFRTLYEAGNFRRAAELSGVTQPALSKGIKVLEQRMATKLFERTSMGVVPTKAGELLNKHLVNMERQARFAEIEVGGLLEGRGGRIHIGTGLVWSQKMVPKTLAKFYQNFPNVQVEITSAISNVLIPMLLNGTLDLIVCELTNEELPKEFNVSKSWKTQRRPWVRSTHPLAKRESVSWAELAEFGWVGHTTDTLLKANIEKKYKQINCNPPLISMETTSLSTMLRIIADTDLVAVLADELEEDAILRNLVRLPVSEADWTMESAVIFRSEILQIQPFRWLIKELSSEHAKENTPTLPP